MFSLRRQQLVAIALFVVAGAHPFMHAAHSSYSGGEIYRVVTRDADCPCVRAAIVPITGPVLNDFAPVVDRKLASPVSCHACLTVAQLPARAPPIR